MPASASASGTPRPRPGWSSRRVTANSRNRRPMMSAHQQQRNEAGDRGKPHRDDGEADLAGRRRERPVIGVSPSSMWRTTFRERRSHRRPRSRRRSSAPSAKGCPGCSLPPTSLRRRPGGPRGTVTLGITVAQRWRRKTKMSGNDERDGQEQRELHVTHGGPDRLSPVAEDRDLDPDGYRGRRAAGVPP